jgi:hypothetical protein
MNDPEGVVSYGVKGTKHGAGFCTLHRGSLIWEKEREGQRLKDFLGRDREMAGKEASLRPNGGQ